MFQHHALFHNDGVDNAAGPAKVRHRRSLADEIRRRALELLDLVQLPPWCGYYPAQLDGQRQCVRAGARRNPNVLLLDEPFGALDAQVRKDLRGGSGEIYEAGPHTITVSTSTTRMKDGALRRPGRGMSQARSSRSHAG